MDFLKVFCAFSLLCCYLCEPQDLPQLNDEYLLCSKTEKGIEHSNQKCHHRDIKCRLFMSELNDGGRSEEGFIKIMDDFVVYSKANQLFETECDKVKSLKIRNAKISENTCLSLLPVEIQGQPYHLTKNGIVVSDYNGSPCPVRDETFIFEGFKFLLKEGKAPL
jgi:hypothetical protein